MRRLTAFLILVAAAAGCGGEETRRDTGHPDTGNEAADSHRIHVCEGTAGKELRTFEVPRMNLSGWTGKALVSEGSGLAFAPDGKSIAYLTQCKAAGRCFSPVWKGR